MTLLILLLPFLLSDQLTIHYVGNAGVSLSDGETTLLVDLPYKSGAFGYMTYDPESLNPAGRVVSVITHRHDDHFSRALFRERDWEIVGPVEVTERLDEERVIALADTIEVGQFRIVPVASPHSDTEHYSYQITWRDQRFYFVGDTETPRQLLDMRDLDIVFITSWLSCETVKEHVDVDTEQFIVYHQFADRRYPPCEDVRFMDQGEQFTLTAGQ